jgi:hypothetical protein
MTTPRRMMTKAASVYNTASAVSTRSPFTRSPFFG